MTTPGVDLTARTLHPGTASGRCLGTAPLSFWGGTDAETGLIIDKRNPLCGTTITGRVLVMRGGRGSSSSSSVLAEQLRRGVGPAAIVLAEPDAIIVTGAIVAAELYQRFLPIVQVDLDELALLSGDLTVTVHAGPATADIRTSEHQEIR